MPSVSGGRALTGFSLRKVAVEEVLRSVDERLGFGGARNWKNSYSANPVSGFDVWLPLSRLSNDVFKLTSSHGAQALLLQLLDRRSQQTSWICADRSLGVGVKEADQEERDIVLPGYPSEGAQIRYCEDVFVTILKIADLELFEIRLIVHVPAKYDRTEAKAILGNAKEFLFRDELSAQDAVHVDPGKLDLCVVLQKLWQGFDGDL